MKLLLTFFWFGILTSIQAQNFSKENYPYKNQNEIIKSIFEFSGKTNWLPNIRIAEINSQYTLDSIYTYTYKSESDSIIEKAERHYPDEYGNDTLVVTSLWDEVNQIWVLQEKVEYKTDPFTKWVFGNLSYKWNTEMNKWIPAWHLWRYRNEYGQVDSLLSFSYDNIGNINYAYKILYQTLDQGKHRIGTQINLDVTTGIWQFYNRIETYLNEEGNIDLEITENWDNELNEFVNLRKLIYDWDSIGYDLVLHEKNWDQVTNEWQTKSVDIQIVTDENGSTERTSLIWNNSQSLWVKSRKVTMTFNDIGRLMVFKGDNWNVNKTDWEPLFNATWKYDSETGERKQLIDHQIWDSNTNNWSIINSEEYEYYMDGYYSQVSKHKWDFNTSSFILNERDFYTYNEKDIIIDMPNKIQNLTGSDTICINSAAVVYKSQWDKDIKSFDWQIIPQEAGSFEVSDSLIYLSLSEDYSGSLGISVAGVNGFGIGEYSDTLAIYIKPAPTKPSIPEGPDYLNQFSGIVEYAVNQDQNTSAYNWHLEPIEAGELNSSDNNVTFNYNFEFEGEFTLTVDASNECGPSGISDALLVRTEIIDTTTLLPPQLPIPLGPDTVCFNDTDIIFKTIKHDTISSYLWSLIPENTGTMNQKDTILSLDLNEVYSGNLKISVAGQNILGRGEYSDTLEIYIKDVPAKPTKISGPEGLNQYSEQNEYSIEKVSFANQYNWNLYPLEAGELISNGIEAQFEIQEGFEGDVEISVSTANECGQSEPSDLKLVSVKIISGLINDLDEYGIKVFPNPALNEINISNQEFIEIKFINIINAQGITTWSKTDLPKVKAHTIPIDFPPGIYTILIEIENNLICEKILVE